MTLRYRCGALPTELPAGLLAHRQNTATVNNESWVRILYKHEFFRLFLCNSLSCACDSEGLRMEFICSSRIWYFIYFSSSIYLQRVSFGKHIMTSFQAVCQLSWQSLRLHIPGHSQVRIPFDSAHFSRLSFRSCSKLHAKLRLSCVIFQWLGFLCSFQVHIPHIYPPRSR